MAFLFISLLRIVIKLNLPSILFSVSRFLILQLKVGFETGTGFIS